MKTKIYSSALTSLFAILITAQSFAFDFNFVDESYIDDIPFNTSMIFHEIMDAEFNFEEEVFINDIPFNTAYIVTYNNATMVTYEFDEESYIDDIPFNTQKLAERQSIQRNLSNDFQMDDEAYINDIPFNTETIVGNMKQITKLNMLIAAK